MQVVSSGGQICNQFWWHHLVVKFWTNTGGTTYNWPNLEPMQVAFYLAGEITQVIDSIPWVRCASGNVFMIAMLWLFLWSHWQFVHAAIQSIGDHQCSLTTFILWVFWCCRIMAMLEGVTWRYAPNVPDPTNQPVISHPKYMNEHKQIEIGPIYGEWDSSFRS